MLARLHPLAGEPHPRLPHGLKSAQDAVDPRVDETGIRLAPAYSPLLINDKESPVSQLFMLQVHPEGAGHGSFGMRIREQGVQDSDLAREGRVAPDLVRRDPDHLGTQVPERRQDRKSTRLNSSISYAVFCLKKKKK